MSQLALRLIAENKITKDKTLDLGNSGLTEMPDLSKLEWLEVLVLSSEWRDWEKQESIFSKNKGTKNRIANFQAEHFPKNIQKLVLANCKISDGWFLENLTKLTTLELGSNKISDGRFLENLTGLTTLVLRNNQISDGRFLEKLTKLTTLDLFSNQISDGRFLENLKRLTSLNLFNNNISDWRFLEKLTGLVRLDLSSNQIGDGRFLEKLTRLTTLVLRNNQISDGRFLEKLTRLTTLDLSYNQISDGRFLEKLTRLTSLYLFYNQINDWRFLEKLTGLTSLGLGFNQISDLSPIGNLSNLQKLFCASTQVSDLFPILGFIQKGIKCRLKGYTRDGEFDFSNCPLTNPPSEIVKQGNAAILNYFKEKQEQGTVKLQEAKMLIVGEGGSGKTSLLRRLYQKEKPLPEENESTKGIEIHYHDFQMPDGSNFRLNVWDFGGQEIYHATHQFFLTKRSLYVLLDDTRRDDRSIHDKAFKYWLEVVDLLSDKSPVLIFQNEKSGRSKNIDMQGIKAKFGNVKDVWQGNLENTGAADKVGEAIEFFARNLPHIGEELPAKWVSIREEMEVLAKKEAYISQKAYFEIYGRHLEFDKTKALFLSQYFHDLGVFLHFQDDKLLARTVILQNTWATEAVFKMLDDETVKSKFGRFDEEDCEQVWSHSEYVEMHPELLALMEKFELCYRLPDSAVWLAPQLLPPSKPDILKDWHRAGDLVLRFRYEFLPKGLVSRLMVRQHRFVKNADLGWVSGVFFEHEGAELLAEIPPSGQCH